jgi:glutamate dehydrogenase
MRRTALMDQQGEWVRAGVPEELARRIAILPALSAAPDIVLVAERGQKPLADVAATLFAVDESFGLGAITAGARQLTAGDHYDRVARDRALEQIEAARRRVTSTVLEQTGNGRKAPRGRDAVEAWLSSQGPDAARIRSLMAEIAGGDLSLARLTVAAGLLGDLAGG